MQATVTQTDPTGIVTVKLSRSCTTQELYRFHTDLSVGDVVEVKRQTNNPYLFRIK